ncbi:extensin family protein [Streptomyces sp. NPDC093595]|uniref:extensin family protein n=1 Tax=Streptomyces sp. NPDC093595 TaxID=3366045 RepID=UPI003802D2DD
MTYQNIPSRRRLMLAGAGAIVATAIKPQQALGAVHSNKSLTMPPAPVPSAQSCANTGDLIGAAEIWAAPTFSEAGFARTWQYDSAFYARLETWLEFWFLNTPNEWVFPIRLSGYGAYVNRNDDCSSMHNFGRALDISRIHVTSGGTEIEAVNARYDLWRTTTGEQLTSHLKRYWATSASLHYHFRHVLTYLYNTEHWNHFHIDNQLSESSNSTFSTGSFIQVQHVQACCRYIWGYSTAIDGQWGPQTESHSQAALARMGRAGSLASSQSNWLEFNKASLRFGTGADSY